MFNLEYLIIYKNDGTPVYSRCFGDMCKIAMKDDVLFSAFLSSLVSFATESTGSKIDEIDLEGITVCVEYSKEDHLNSLLLSDLRLLFLYNQTDDFTIAAGFNEERYKEENGYSIVTSFLQDVETFIGKHPDINWNDIIMETYLAFESELLREVIHPFFSDHHIKSKCPFGDNCPLRLAIIENKEKTIFGRLRSKIKEYRGFSMMKKMARMMKGSKYKTSQ